MSLSLYGVPDGQQKGQSVWPCPSVYSPATALGSLSSVALSSAPASVTLTQRERRDANYHRFFTRIWSGFLVEATNPISSRFLREATGRPNSRELKSWDDQTPAEIERGSSLCFLNVWLVWRPYGESNPCRRREREAIYRNSTETCGMDSTVRSSKVL
jgi:hypothetical protein